MIEIKVKDGGECKIAINGDIVQCAHQMSQVAKHIFKQTPLIADSLLLGIASERTKEEMLEVVDMAYKSIEMGNMSKDVKDKHKNKEDLKEPDSLLSDILKDLFGGKK